MSNNEPIKPVAPVAPSPPPGMSISKIVLISLGGVFLIGSIVLAAWEQGRVSLLSALDVRGSSRMQADLMVRQRAGSPQSELFALYRQDADRGDPYALWEVGNRYQTGQGVGQNFKLARQYWEKAAKTGEAEVLMLFAEKCEKGDGRVMPVSPLASVLALRQAASQGHAPAQSRISSLLTDYARRKDSTLLLVADALSPDQKEGIQRLSSVQKALSDDTQASGVDRASVARAAIDEVRANIAGRLVAEAYVWSAIQAADTSDDEVHSRRDRLASTLAEADLQLAQEAIDRWRVADSPGVNSSPFAKVDGLVPTVDEGAPKGSLAEALVRLSQIAEPASEVPATAARPLPAAGTVSGNSNATGPTAHSWESSRSLMLAANEIVTSTAVRRNVYLAIPYGNAVGFRASGQEKAAVLMQQAAIAVMALAQRENPGAHPSAIRYLRDLANNLRTRALCLRAISEAARGVAAGTLQEGSYRSTEEFELLKFRKAMEQAQALLSTAEAEAKAAFGKGYSMIVQEEAYRSAMASHEQRLRELVGRMDANSFYALIVGMKIDTWTFEPGELRELRILSNEVKNGAATVRVQIRLQGNQSRSYRTMELTLVVVTEGDKVALALASL